VQKVQVVEPENGRKESRPCRRSEISSLFIHTKKIIYIYLILYQRLSSRITNAPRPTEAQRRVSVISTATDASPPAVRLVDASLKCSPLRALFPLNLNNSTFPILPDLYGKIRPPVQTRSRSADESLSRGKPVLLLSSVPLCFLLSSRRFILVFYLNTCPP